MLYPKPLVSKGRAALFTASALTLLLFSGCQNGRRPAADTSALGTAQARPEPSPEANIFVDEPKLAKPYAVIGGAVENVGSVRLENLSVEIELRRRADGVVERREASIEPADLEPGKKGRFTLKVLSEEWSSSRVVALRSGARAQEVAFKALPGAKRPPEKIKENVVISRPTAPKRASDSEFINTPDTPYKVP